MLLYIAQRNAPYFLRSRNNRARTKVTANHHLSDNDCALSSVALHECDAKIHRNHHLSDNDCDDCFGCECRKSRHSHPRVLARHHIDTSTHRQNLEFLEVFEGFCRGGVVLSRRFRRGVSLRGYRSSLAHERNTKTCDGRPPFGPTFACVHVPYPALTSSSNAASAASDFRNRQ